MISLSVELGQLVPKEQVLRLIEHSMLQIILIALLLWILKKYQIYHVILRIKTHFMLVLSLQKLSFLKSFLDKQKKAMS